MKKIVFVIMCLMLLILCGCKKQNLDMSQPSTSRTLITRFDFDQEIKDKKKGLCGYTLYSHKH